MGLKLRYILNILLLVSFIIILFTGIMKQPFLFRYFTGLALPMGQISTVHDWAGIILVALGVIHIIINRGWWASATRGVFGGKK